MPAEWPKSIVLSHSYYMYFLLHDQGLRSLDDLREKGNLTSQQKIGLNHYHDFLDRMPREEAGEIEQVVRIACTLFVLIPPIFFCPENEPQHMITNNVAF